MNDFAKVSELVAEFQRKLEVIIKRDGARHEMDAQIPYDLMTILEDELAPALDAAIRCIEWEPSDEDLCPGESPVTMAEMHSAAHAQHIALHS